MMSCQKDIDPTQKEGQETKIDYKQIINMLNSLSYCECYNCQNYFFIHEISDGMNDPTYCPYCGIEFDNMVEGDL
jgi:NAD-dependent SIR2 family protein deacetylase